MNVVDIILLVFLGFCALNGIKEGFIRSVGGLAALVAGIWAAIAFRLSLVFYFENKFGWVSSLEAWLIKKIPFFQLSSDTGELIVSGEPSQFEQWLIQMRTILLPSGSNFNPAEQIALILISAAAFVLIFVLVRGIVGVVIQAVDHLVKATPLRSVNRLLGLATGLLKGLLYLVVVSLLLLPLLKTSAFIGSDFSNDLVLLINHSFVYEWVEVVKQGIAGLMAL